MNEGGLYEGPGGELLHGSGREPSELVEVRTCQHAEKVYISKFMPAPSPRLFIIELICKQCHARLAGRVLEVSL
jgi:hypothetical protein